MPTSSRSLSLMQGCDITKGFAGGGTSPEVTCGWKSAIDAIVK